MKIEDLQQLSEDEIKSLLFEYTQQYDEEERKLVSFGQFIYSSYFKCSICGEWCKEEDKASEWQDQLGYANDTCTSCEDSLRSDR